MGDYLALAWPPGQPGVEAQALREAILADGTWRVAYEEFCILVCVSGPRPPAVQVLPARQGVLIGEVFDTEQTLAGRPSPFDAAILKGLEPSDAALVLTRCAWGRYVALFTPHRRAPEIYRDPLGGLEAVTWTRGDITLVGSQIPAAGPQAPADLAIDWARVEAMVADIDLASDALGLRGVQAIGPGVLRSGPDAREALVLWTPAEHARRARAARPVDLAGPARLAARIDACVAALSLGRSAIVAEVSGGLDSAIVAASLTKAGAPVVDAINHYWPDPESDERGYAADVAHGLGLSLTAVAREDLAYDLERLLAAAGGVRPPFSAQDPDHDRDMAGRLRALGADALFTGHGGDAVFFQMPDRALALDILWGAPTCQGRAGALASLARRLRMSVWRLIGAALRGPGGDPAGFRPSRFLNPPGAAPPRHPWRRKLGGVSAAKRVQIEALIGAQLVQGESLRGRVADLINPLLCQPVVEYCLSIPAPLLAVGELDRPYARAAFCDRLPASIRHRRGKGDVTSVFARSLARGLDVLGPFLMEGRLAAHGLIDRDKLAPLLDPEVMVWRDLTGEIMRVVFVEAWVRVWETRVEARRQDSPLHEAASALTTSAREDAAPAGEVSAPPS